MSKQTTTTVVKATLVQDEEGKEYLLEAMLLEVRYTTRLLGRTLEESLLYHPYFRTPEGKGEHRDKVKEALSSLWELYSDLAGQEKDD